MEKPTAGELIRKKRKKMGISISKLAELSGVSQPHISQIENGKRNPSYEIIHKLKAVLDIDFYLFAWAAGLYTDEEYEEYLEQKTYFESLPPQELDKIERADYEAFNYFHKLEKFKKKKYVRIESFLNNNIESIYIGDHKLTDTEIKMLIHLLEGKEKNYPTDQEIEEEFIYLRNERKQEKPNLENGNYKINYDEYYEYDLD